ncbi:MAG TPA: cytidylate kinase-like family protein [Tepidisphaeraceae bacterium]|jgi:cytidylate kinase|nr:cytidylate kinase-like family protein [Tepidisphaeraceae bacterium]
MAIHITIGRQIGSGGGELGHRLANRLGAVFIDRQVMQRTAARLGCSEAELTGRREKVMPFWQRFIHLLAIGAPEGVYTDARRIPELTDESLFAAQIEAIRELCTGCSTVLIGYAGFHLLRDIPGIVRIFVHADHAFRMARMKNVYGIIDETDAADAIERTDRQRERFIAKIAGVSWTDLRNYDLTLNMSHIGFDAAEETVMRFIEQRIGTGMPNPHGSAT